MGIRKAFREATRTVNEVQQWGEATKAYAEEQRVKRGEQPPKQSKPVKP